MSPRPIKHEMCKMIMNHFTCYRHTCTYINIHIHILIYILAYIYCIIIHTRPISIYSINILHRCVIVSLEVYMLITLSDG